MMSPETQDCTAKQSPAVDISLGLAGALAGGVAGYFLFFLIARGGFYAIILPGALIGIGCGGLSGRKSVPLGIICAVLALAAGIFTEWRFAPFIKDRSFTFFLENLGSLRQVTQILILLGGFFAFWFGVGRDGGTMFRKRTKSTPSGQDGK